MDQLKRPLVTAGLFFLIARGYAVSRGVDVPVMRQLTVSGVLAASALASEFIETPDRNPAVKSLTTGSLFAGSMYVLLGSDAVAIHAILGTLSAYAAEVVVPESLRAAEVVDPFYRSE
jgi:hypothetical protein